MFQNNRPLLCSTSPSAAVYLRHGTPNVSLSPAASLAGYGHSAPTSSLSARPLFDLPQDAFGGGRTLSKPPSTHLPGSKAPQGYIWCSHSGGCLAQTLLHIIRCQSTDLTTEAIFRVRILLLIIKNCPIELWIRARRQQSARCSLEWFKFGSFILKASSAEGKIYCDW